LAFDLKSKKFLAIIVFILIVVSIASYYYYTKKKDDDVPGFSPETVTDGDTVKIDYVAHLSTQDGPVFETTILSVAKDDNITKSNTFDYNRIFEPMTIQAGGTSPNTGLAKGIIGLEANSTGWIQVPMEDGYGKHHSGLANVVIPPFERVPLYQSVHRADFLTYFGVSEDYLEKLTPIPHPFWGWTIQIKDVTQDTVEFANAYNEDVVGMEVGKFPWRSTITAILSNEIHIEHDVDAVDMGSVVDSEDLRTYDMDLHKELSKNWTDQQIPGSLGKGYIDGIKGGIRLDFNLETAGKTLWYEVSVLSIEPGD
jgi:FKBP-type peptidyl-prolyl cis-trans isomerase 2